MGRGQRRLPFVSPLSPCCARGSLETLLLLALPVRCVANLVLWSVIQLLRDRTSWTLLAAFFTSFGVTPCCFATSLRTSASGIDIGAAKTARRIL